MACNIYDSLIKIPININANILIDANGTNNIRIYYYL